MTGAKRPNDENDETLPRKVAKADDSAVSKAGDETAKRKNKQTIAYATFRAHALPMHVILTHTPPVMENEGERTASSDPDPGHIAAITLLPSKFKTGSYGWKGNSRIQVELQGAKGKQKECVAVMLSINATVMGSKQKGQEEVEETQPVVDEEQTEE